MLFKTELWLYGYSFFFFNDTATTEIYTLSLHDALPICGEGPGPFLQALDAEELSAERLLGIERSEEHTSELQSRSDLVCRLLLEKKKRVNSPLSMSHACYLTLTFSLPPSIPRPSHNVLS